MKIETLTTKQLMGAGVPELENLVLQAEGVIRTLTAKRNALLDSPIPCISDRWQAVADKEDEYTMQIQDMLATRRQLQLTINEKVSA